MNAPSRLCNTSSMLLKRGPNAPGWIRHFSATRQLRTCSSQTARSSSSEWTSSGNWVTRRQRWRPLWESWAWARTPTPCWESWSGAGPTVRPARPVLTVIRGAQARGTLCCLPAGPWDPAGSHRNSGTRRVLTRNWGLSLLTAAMLPSGNLKKLFSFFYAMIDSK